MAQEDILFDVFISYRRKGGSEQAQLVKSELRQRGIAEERIFLDTHNLHEGDFRSKIKTAIGQSRNVVVIISQGCFDEVRETDYWYMEIREAMSQGKHIIPVLFDSITSLDVLEIPKELDELKVRNYIRYQHEYADATFDKLATFLGIEDLQPYSPQKIRRGCLLKYRGCMFSFVLIALLLVILVPIAFQGGDADSSSELTAMNEEKKEGESLQEDDGSRHRTKIPNAIGDQQPSLASSDVEHDGTHGKTSAALTIKQLRWAKYEGEMKNNRFHGRGVLRITKCHTISGETAQPGEWIDGTFRDGNIVLARWHKADGSVVLMKDVDITD